MPAMVQATQPADEFDPARGVFKAMRERPVTLEPLNVGDLTPLLRVLLVTDGTVTRVLEAYCGEPVAVQRLGQRQAPAGAAAGWLVCAAEDVAIHRQVMLTGMHSRKLFAYAESVIVPGRLTSAMRAGLENEPEGLGKILVDSAMETRREALWYGLEPAATPPEPVARLSSGMFVVRSYRVFAEDRPMMMITERFPRDLAPAVPQ